MDCDSLPRPAALPEITPAGDLDHLLHGVETAVMTSTGRAVGFALDADSPLADRWKAVRERLGKSDVKTPDIPPPEGFVGESAQYKAKVGVWLMPDNQQDGTLETFLRGLVDDGDPLIGHAECATTKAKGLGAAFRESDSLKATIHAWLAWQEEPGLPYGTAIRARYFGHDSPAAKAFVMWFKRLYGIP